VDEGTFDIKGKHAMLCISVVNLNMQLTVNQIPGWRQFILSFKPGQFL